MRAEQGRVGFDQGSGAAGSVLEVSAYNTPVSTRYPTSAAAGSSPALNAP
jgi:hypothetical protein